MSVVESGALWSVLQGGVTSLGDFFEECYENLNIYLSYHQCAGLLLSCSCDAVRMPLPPMLLLLLGHVTDGLREESRVSFDRCFTDICFDLNLGSRIIEQRR